MTTRDAVSAKILSIRTNAGNPGVSCPTCGRNASGPYRRWDQATGRVVEGCVDAFHTGKLYGESEAWHSRKVAVAIRRETLRSITQ